MAVIQMRGLGVIWGRWRSILQDAAEVMVPWRHGAYVQRHRAALIVSRVQLMASLLAVLVPLWIVVDVIVFDTWLWMSIAPMRLVSAGVFVALAWPREVADPRRAAPVMLSVLVLVAPIFYLASQPLLATVQQTGVAGIASDIYDFLPCTILACLSIFPLTVVEVGAAWLVVFAVMTFSERVLLCHPWSMLVGPLWLLVLIGGTVMVSGASQL